jgi:saccharopine dehydrogenase (NAD+, L-lysine-forming)
MKYANLSPESRGKNILVLGGYGAAGRAIVINLLKFTQSDITIAGRDINKCKDLASSLKKRFPKRIIETTIADAHHKESLIDALQKIDLMIVATTTPDSISFIAEAALETDSDLMDIFIRGDVVEKIKQYEKEIIHLGRKFITQAGIHPGLIAPIIKYAKSQFDQYEVANVFLVMDLVVETPESMHEIIYEVMQANSLVLKEGKWIKAGYKNAITREFKSGFGSKSCYPLAMKELIPLQKELSLKTAGAYAGGFNTFIDVFVFSLAFFIGLFSKKWSQKICGKLMFWSIHNKFSDPPKVEFQLEAKGIKNDQEKVYQLLTYSDDGYEFTALAVLACLFQYFDNTISNPGLYLMGNVVDEKRVVNHLQEMGVIFQET